MNPDCQLCERCRLCANHKITFFLFLPNNHFGLEFQFCCIHSRYFLSQFFQESYEQLVIDLKNQSNTFWQCQLVHLQNTGITICFHIYHGLYLTYLLSQLVDQIFELLVEIYWETNQLFPYSFLDLNFSL